MRLRRALALAALSGALGCDQFPKATCDRSDEGNPTVRYAEGTAEAGVYMSSPWDGERLYFPGGMRYALEHKLGAAPRWVSAFLSFDAHGGAFAPAAGNQAELLDVGATTLTVVNDSCVDYWLLVTAGAGSKASPP
jgi:hypothetical protein